MAIGSYSEFRNVNEEDKIIFGQVIIDIDGIGYEPFAVATQLVNGVNYKFLCNATAITNHPSEYLAVVIIYQPFNGNPVLIHTARIDIPS